MANKKRVTWTVAVAEGASNTEPRTHLRCERCGEVHVPDLPMDVDRFVAAIGAFNKLHAHCEERP